MADPAPFRRDAKHRPITPATVTVNGYVYKPKETIWAGLRWRSAQWRTGSIWGTPDEKLSVPFCHIVDDMPDDECGWYRIRSRDKGWTFVVAANGNWVLQEVVDG